jgi:D-alanine--poly(phosphoribitol) ligase subunit 1
MQRVAFSDSALRIHREINDTARPYPRDSSVPERFEHWARHRPDAPAAVQGEREVSYGELDRSANALAHSLMDRRIGLGSTVGVCMARSPEMLVALLGILKSGATYVPLDPAWPDDRLRAAMTAASCALVVTDRPEVGTRLAASDVGTLAIGPDTLIGTDAGPPCPARGEDLACINFTSGSTGQPKGVMIRHRGINRLVTGATYGPLHEHSRVLQITPFTFDIATWEIWGALLNGGTSVMYPAEPIRLSVLDEVVHRGRVTITLLATALFNTVVDELPGTLDEIECITTGGEAHSLRHMAKALSRYGPGRVVNLYGPTECTCIGTFHPIDELPPDGMPVPMGKPIQNTRLYLLGAACSRLCEPGEVGEICLAGDGLAAGYLGQPELTSERFVYRDIGGVTERLYRTGDFGHLLPSGDAVFEGRRDDQVKVRSFRIELGEITHHLNDHPTVKQSCVTVREAHGEKSLVAFVVPAAANATPDGLRDHLARKLPVYMVPTEIHLCEAFPLTPNGKIDRLTLLRAHVPSAPSGAPTQ